jgi:hypothetical protein
MAGLILPPEVVEDALSTGISQGDPNTVDPQTSDMVPVTEVEVNDDIITGVHESQPVQAFDQETYDTFAATGVDPAHAAENNTSVQLGQQHPRKKKSPTEEELLKNDLWIMASRIAMTMFSGQDAFAAGQGDPMQLEPDKPLTAENMTDEEAADWGMDMMGWFNYNLPSMGMNVNRMRSADPRQKMAMYYLMNMYDDKQMSWDGVWRGVKGIMTDPSTYVGLSTLGIGTVVGAAVKAASRTSVKAALKASLKPILAGAAEAGVYTGADDALRQAVSIMAGAQEGYDPVRGTVATTIGAVAGGGLTGVVSSALPLARKGAQAFEDTVQNAMRGDTLTMGVGPTGKAGQFRADRSAAFTKLAQDQRGEPERAMLRVQGANGGGVLNHLVEHTGDITNRMADKYDFFKDGLGYDVKNKVDRMLAALRHPYGFEREHLENLAANARARGVTVSEVKAGVDASLLEYADAHRALEIYNDPQRWARDAAVAVGEQNWVKAEENLAKISDLMQDEDAYRKAAGTYNGKFVDNRDGPGRFQNNNVGDIASPDDVSGLLRSSEADPKDIGRGSGVPEVLPDVPPIITDLSPGAVEPTQGSPAITFRQQVEPTNIPSASGGKVGPGDIGRYWDADYLARYGRQGDPGNPQDMDIAIQNALAEADYQLQGIDSGKGWYDQDIEETWDVAGEIFPELNDGIVMPPNPNSVRFKNGEDVSAEALRVLTTAIAAPLSFGNRPKPNFNTAMKVLDGWMTDGEIPHMNPETGKLWTMRAVSSESLRFLQSMVNEHGVEGAAEWLMTMHSVRDIRAARRAAGVWKDSQGMGVPGGQDSMKLGAFSLGRKGGPFFLNLNGIEDTTADLWFTRTWNRQFGRMTSPNLPKSEVLLNQPRATERGPMKEWNQEVAGRLGETEQDSQAILWYFEQQLFNSMGQASAKPSKFSDGAKQFREAGERGKYGKR